MLVELDVEVDRFVVRNVSKTVVTPVAVLADVPKLVANAVLKAVVVVRVVVLLVSKPVL